MSSLIVPTFKNPRHLVTNLTFKKDPEMHQEILQMYMRSLRPLAPFLPQEESEIAKHLIHAQQHLWQILLRTRLAVQYLTTKELNLTPKLQSYLQRLYRYYVAKDVRYVYFRKKGPTLGLQNFIAKLAERLKYLDVDKQLENYLLNKLVSVVMHGGSSIIYPAADVAFVKALQKLQDKIRDLRNLFIRKNLRLVINVARSMHLKEIPLADAIQAGNLGLLRAIERFNYRLGFRFSTYAHWWIKHAITRAHMNDFTLIRLPVHVAEMRKRLDKLQAQTLRQSGQVLAEEEAAKILHFTPKILGRLRKVPQTVVTSLDEPVKGETERTYLDVLADEEHVSILDELLQEDLYEHLRNLLTRLTPVEQDIVKRRFGFYTGESETLDAISKIHHLSRERIRQIQESGLHKMRLLCKKQALL